MLYLISYDISDDKQRRQAAVVLEGCGQRVQASVFESDLSEREYKAVREQLRKRVVLGERDSIRFYRLCGNCRERIEIIGNGLDPAHSPDIFIV